MDKIKCKQVAQIEGSFESTGRVYSAIGLSPTINTCGGGNREPKIIEPLAYDEQNGYLRKDGIVGTITTDGSSPKHNNRVVEPLVYDGFNQQIRTDSTTSGTITRNVGADLKRNGQGIIEQKSPNIRVRKLTEKECFRLQGVKDKDFSKIRQNQSKSSCYHLAGDSITTSVLMALFGEMLDIKWKDKVDDLVEEWVADEILKEITEGSNEN